MVGVDDDGLRALMRYADQLALAFQIMDDVRDVEGGPALGKDAGGDLDRRVPTWPLIERLAMRPGSREMWLSEQTSSAELQTDLVHRGATKVARAALVAVGPDYNLLLAMQIREEARAGLGAAGAAFTRVARQTLYPAAAAVIPAEFRPPSQFVAMAACHAATRQRVAQRGGRAVAARHAGAELRFAGLADQPGSRDRRPGRS